MFGNISRRALAFAAGGALVFFAGFGLAQQAPGSQVVIDSHAFTPASLTVPAGTQVVWLNQDDEPHNIVSGDPQTPYKSKVLDTNDKFARLFDKPGIYQYFCSIHSEMTGTITVK